jgi:hypothetical protein
MGHVCVPASPTLPPILEFLSNCSKAVEIEAGRNTSCNEEHSWCCDMHNELCLHIRHIRLGSWRLLLTTASSMGPADGEQHRVEMIL